MHKLRQPNVLYEMYSRSSNILARDRDQANNVK